MGTGDGPSDGGERAIAPGNLLPWSQNARTHSKKQVRQIADSIRAFGFTNPVLIDAENRITAGQAVYDELKNLIVWAKDNGGMGTFYRSRHELIFAFKVGPAPHLNSFELGQNGRYRTNVWEYRGVNTLKAGRMEELSLHPTAKPVEMIADAIRDVSGRGEIVLDLFGGSGSTLIAAEKTGRRARLVELDPLYCDRILVRWEAYAKDAAEQLVCGWVAEPAPTLEAAE